MKRLRIVNVLLPSPLPQDAKVTDYLFAGRVLSLKLEHPSFDEVADGERIPAADVGMDGKKGTVIFEQISPQEWEAVKEETVRICREQMARNNAEPFIVEAPPR